ncbi:lipolytic protein-like protein G-D-S-L family [Polyplosphaeria fusca]|uniref:Lipolytic protein-like protein G-D-S-L family n=1 Tax=Polyplosphaeria fusca TaxID=682080 RepID=A0A9P4UX31_9PLEO|nr:lipolytic protein-like protein G-D-S-L family [Polyplosphaeria fusca]
MLLKRPIELFVFHLLCLSNAVALASPIIEQRQDADYHWVNTWTSMPQLVESSNMPPSQYSSPNVLKNATLRQTFHLSLGASSLKLTISNTFGGSDLPITSASLSLPASGAAGTPNIQPSPLAAVTVDGKASFVVPKGQVVTSDEIHFEVKPQSVLTVSLYSSAGQTGSSITGHPGSRTTSYFAQGNQVNSTTLTSPAKSVHWYFVSGVQAYVPRSAAGALMVLGDSITDGRGSDDDKNNRWPDLVLARLQRGNNTAGVAVCNQAAGGNRVLRSGLGPPLLQRYTRDAIDQPGTQIGDQLIAAYQKIIADAKKAGYSTIGATITPFCAPSPSQQAYSDKNREATRQRVNKWILTSGAFDHVVDFSAMVESKTSAGQLDSRYNGGDYLHPNVAGYQAMADGFPIDIFKA